MNLAALEAQAREILERYDEPRAAMPLLWLVQEKSDTFPPRRSSGSGAFWELRSRTSARWFPSIRCPDAASGPARASRLHEPALHVGGSRSAVLAHLEKRLKLALERQRLTGS